MGDPRGFLRLERVGFQKRDPRERVHDYRQYFALPDDRTLRDQGGRCMDCGVPFCQEGCPLGNKIPDWNDLVYGDRWREALTHLHATNNFPEFTGLICPAPCESACVLDINDDPVTIEQIEGSIAERGWAEGWIVPEPPDERSGKTVAVVGLGPAGMAVAAELNRFGHRVTVFERDEAVGGLMRYGVPDAKLEKWIIDRRAGLLAAEGIEFVTGVDVGTDVTTEQLRARHDAVVIAIGSRVHRDLEAPGRELGGVHFAMDYLYQRNRYVAADEGRPARRTPPDQVISAEGRRVVVVGVRFGGSGQGVLAGRPSAGSGGYTSSKRTSSAPSRRAFEMQSMPVSPPPTTTTRRPAALIRSPGAGSGAERPSWRATWRLRW